MDNFVKTSTEVLESCDGNQGRNSKRVTQNKQKGAPKYTQIKTQFIPESRERKGIIAHPNHKAHVKLP